MIICNNNNNNNQGDRGTRGDGTEGREIGKGEGGKGGGGGEILACGRGDQSKVVPEVLADLKKRLGSFPDCLQTFQALRKLSGQSGSF